MHIGEKLKMVRNILGMTQDEVAEKINRSRPMIGIIEKTGQGHPLTISAICKVLKVKPEQLEHLEEKDIKDFLTGKSNPEKIQMDHLQKENNLLTELLRARDEKIRMLEEKIATYTKQSKKRTDK